MPEYPPESTRTPLAADCRRCPDLVESRECIAWGNGPPDASVVVVGEAPGAGDPDADRWKGGNWTGMAYTSRHSGRRVRDLLADAGHAREDCYFTNAVKCFPSAASAASDGEGSNREPTATERTNCRPYLLREVEQVGPAAVVATGRHATQSLFAAEGRDLDGFLETVLDPVPCPTVGAPVVPLLHPSYQEVWLSRLGYTREEYVAELREVLATLGA